MSAVDLASPNVVVVAVAVVVAGVQFFYQLCYVLKKLRAEKFH